MSPGKREPRCEGEEGPLYMTPTITIPCEEYERLTRRDQALTWLEERGRLKSRRFCDAKNVWEWNFHDPRSLADAIHDAAQGIPAPPVIREWTRDGEEGKKKARILAESRRRSLRERGA